MRGATPTGIVLRPIAGIPEVTPGMSIAGEIMRALGEERLRDGDILAVTSKIVSKAEGCFVPAHERQALIERDTIRVVASIPGGGGSAIVRSRLGIVAAAAGVDASNVDGDWVLALPDDPDASALAIAGELGRLAGVDIGVIVTDTVGRAWRSGQTDIAIGCAHVRIFDDVRGGKDTAGKLLSVTQRCIADEIAAAADLVKGKVAGVPVALVRGMGQYVDTSATDCARDIIRPEELDLFRLGTSEAYGLGYSDGAAGAVARDV